MASIYRAFPMGKQGSVRPKDECEQDKENAAERAGAIRGAYKDKDAQRKNNRYTPFFEITLHSVRELSPAGVSDAQYQQRCSHEQIPFREAA